MDASQAATSEYLQALNTAVMRAAQLAAELAVARAEVAVAREQIKALKEQAVEQKPTVPQPE